ncbi:hypothetical protein [Leifsonia sp. NCR5]|uniref:hypothetical protein n=1 Tax=Leifsonia sp. NCR5 TaxID=1978342 RepID=UPI0015C44E64|nr:hypothetical protein [Leifsonia sp. NCR5]
MVDAMKASEREIVRGINERSIDESNLVNRDAWKLLCQVRGRNYRSVDEEAWQELCSRRGYLLHRRNPRGF